MIDINLEKLKRVRNLNPKNIIILTEEDIINDMESITNPICQVRGRLIDILFVPKKSKDRFRASRLYQALLPQLYPRYKGNIEYY